MIIFIAENQTASDVFIADIGETIPASGSLELSLTQTVSDIRDSLDLFDAINNGQILLNYGNGTLTKEESINYATVGLNQELLHNVIIDGDFSYGDVPDSNFSFTAVSEGIYEVDWFLTINYDNESDYAQQFLYGQLPGEGSLSIKSRSTSAAHASWYYAGSYVKWMVKNVSGTVSVKANLQGSPGVSNIHTSFNVKRLK